MSEPDPISVNVAQTAGPEPAPATKPKRGSGRPTKYTPEAVNTICGAVADGTPFRYAAALGGISHETFCQWQRRYPEFADAIQEALAKGIQKRLKLIETASEEGDVKAAQWWLEHVLPEHFAKTRIQLEHTGTMQHSFVIPQEVLNQIAEARRTYEHKPETK